MSDVDDWTGVSAGATTLLASGTVDAQIILGTARMTVDVVDIPATVRSLLLLVLPSVVSAGTTDYELLTFQGTNTKQTWYPAGVGGPWYNEQGGTLPVAGSAMFPQYVPMYGLTDPDVVIEWHVNGGDITDQAQYWVLGLPDPDLLGSAGIPIAVANPLTAGVGSAVPLLVSTAPAVARTKSSSFGAGLVDVALHNFGGSPAAGMLRVLESAYTSSTTLVYVDGVPIPPGARVPIDAYVDSTGQHSYQATTANGSFWASYHDEPA